MSRARAHAFAEPALQRARFSYCGGATTRTGNTAAMSAKSSRLRVITAAPCNSAVAASSTSLRSARRRPDPTRCLRANNGYPDIPSRAAALLPDKPRSPALQHRGESPLQRGQIPLEPPVVQEAINQLRVSIELKIFPRLPQFLGIEVQCLAHFSPHSGTLKDHLNLTDVTP